MRWLLEPTCLIRVAMLLCLAVASSAQGEEEVARPAFPGPDRLLLPSVSPGVVRVDGDLAEWAGRPFVYLSDRWQRIQADSELPAREDRAAAALARDEEALAVVASRSEEYICLLVEGELRRVIQPFLPGAERCRYPYRLTPFAGKLLYAPRLFWTDEVPQTPAPLHLVADFGEGGWLVDGFQRRQVHDIIVRNGSVFVLTSKPAGEGYACELLRSADARNWTRIAEFATPARAESLEEVAGVFYVGLASGYEEANPASGCICRLE